MSKMNPLAKYTKIEEIFTKLVSNNAIKYKDGVLEDGVKCGICARSARDEIMLNSPDALLNGDAIVRVIENCVPNVLNANELYVNDIEQLLIGIKLASKEDSYDINVVCPVCEQKGSFSRDLSYLMETAELFKEQPTLELSNGLVLKLKPLTWREFSDFSVNLFNEQKRVQVIENNDELKDEEKIKFYAEIFEKMTQLNYDMIIDQIQCIVTPDEVEVDDKEFINEWLGSQPASIIKEIKTVIDTMDSTGVSHTMEAECPHCNHEWLIEGLKYDPSNFFGLSFSSQNQKK